MLTARWWEVLPCVVLRLPPILVAWLLSSVLRMLRLRRCLGLPLLLRLSLLLLVLRL